MIKSDVIWRKNLRRAKSIWGSMNPAALDALKQLTKLLAVSVPAGDLQFLDNGWYVTHAGLLRIAQRRRCHGIETVINEHLSDPSTNRWIFKAIVFKNSGCKGFAGYGDADPSNVSSLVQGAEMRIAETRAVNRALRKAYGIGVCSVEELGTQRGSQKQTRESGSSASNGHEASLRDQLCILIRQHNLNSILVKAYAADFCGTATLRDASRELVESFISHLSAAAKENRAGLICKLNSYAQPAQVTQ
jgi:hypothetical protein